MEEKMPHERKRRCTDIICLFVFILFLIVEVFVAIIALYFGRPEVFLYPRDSFGKLCGFYESVKDRPYLFFFDLAECAKVGVSGFWSGCPTIQICVKSCPSEYWVYFLSELYELTGKSFLDV